MAGYSASGNGTLIVVHASCVALKGSGLLILGKSGAGKSALALQLMAWGAKLVADDQTILTPKNGVLYASPPRSIRGLIEARGVGLLEASNVDEARLDFAVDLDRREQQRLPEKHSVCLAGSTLTCLYKVEGPHFPAAVLQYLRSGRKNP